MLQKCAPILFLFSSQDIVDIILRDQSSNRERTSEIDFIILQTCKIINPIALKRFDWENRYNKLFQIAIGMFTK